MTSSMSGYSGLRGNRRDGQDIIPKGYRKGQLQQFTPEQMQLFQRLFGDVGPDSYLARLAGGEEGMFDELEAPALRQFSELLGGLGSRFSGMGDLGGRKSSGFQNTATSAASNFAQELQANRQALQRQASQDLRGLTSDLLSYKPKQDFMIKKQEKESSGWGGLAGAGLGAAGGFFAGGPTGALKGAELGYKVGSAF